MLVTLKNNVFGTVNNKLYQRRGPHVGIEVELEDVYLDCDDADAICGGYWEAKDDPSLRCGGIEYVSIPMKQDELSNAMVDLQELLNTHGGNATLRTGVHIHQNITHLKWEQVFNVLTLYALFEPYVFKVFAPGREESHFCVPMWADTHLQKMLYTDVQTFRKGFRTQDGGEVKGVEYNPEGGLMEVMMPSSEKGLYLNCFDSAKYAALNVLPMKKFGTLEWRMFPGTTQTGQILHWADFIFKLEEIALRFKDPSDIILEYEKHNRDKLGKELGFSWERINPEWLEDSAIAATLIAGYPLVSHEELDWEIK